MIFCKIASEGGENADGEEESGSGSIHCHLHDQSLLTALDAEHQGIADGTAGEGELVMVRAGFAVGVLGRGEDDAHEVAGIEGERGVAKELVVEGEGGAVGREGGVEGGEGAARAAA